MIKKQSPEKQSAGFTPRTRGNGPSIHTNTLAQAESAQPDSVPFAALYSPMGQCYNAKRNFAPWRLCVSFFSADSYVDSKFDLFP